MKKVTLNNIEYSYQRKEIHIGDTIITDNLDNVYEASINDADDIGNVVVSQKKLEMKTNTLVTHKKLSSLGIGCVAKIMSKKVKVNFGKDDVMTCDPKQLNVIDTSKCKTVDFNKFKRRALNDKGTLNYAIVGNELKHYVGIGWVTQRVVTYEDLKKYPRVI